MIDEAVGKKLMKRRKNITGALALCIILSGIAGCHARQQERPAKAEMNSQTGEDPKGEDTQSEEKPQEEPKIIVVNDVAGEVNTGHEEMPIAPEQNRMSEQTEKKDEQIDEQIDEQKTTEDFYISGITDEIFARIQGLSFKDDCTLPREDLRYLHVLHKDIDGNVHEGEMIVNVHIAEDVLEILKELYEQDYPIEKIRLVDEYGADDEASMEDNNSSCFNFRFVPRTTKVSKHGLGLAVDINTLYNPYITTVDGRINVEPSNGEPYADRDREFDYKIEKGDLCYRLFKEHGFEWGGEWKNSKDYQHFEIPSARINEWY